MALHLVTGGSGFVGSCIAKTLINRGEEVRVLDLWKDDSLSEDIQFYLGDINDRELVSKALKGVDYVHHNVALVPLTKAGDRFRVINVDGTAVALDESCRAGVKFFSHMSSSAIFGSPNIMPITNETQCDPIEIYGRAKLDAELLVKAAGKEGMKVSSIRPRTIVGAGRLGIFEILFDWIADNANIYVIGSGDNLFQFVHVEDIAEVSIQACLQQKPGFYNVGTDKFDTLKNDLGKLIKHAGSASRVKGLPVDLTISTLKFLDNLKLSPLGPWHYLTYHKPFYFDISPVKESLGWKPRYSNEQILNTAYDWYISEGRCMPRDSKSSIHKSSVKQGILRLLKAIS